MNLLLFIIALLVYIYRPSWLMLLWIVTMPLIAPLLVLRAGINDFDEVQQFLYHLMRTFNRLFVFIILYKVIVNRRTVPKGIIYFVSPFLFLAIFLLFHDIIIQTSIELLYQNMMGALYCITAMILFMIDKETRPKLKSLFVVVLIVLLIQLLWLPLNMNGIFAYVSRYQEILTLNDGGEASMMPGTFARSNVMADYVSIVYLFIFIDYFSRRQIPKWLFILISMCVCVLLVFAGSKLPVVCTIVSFLLCTVLFCKKGVLVALIVSVLGFSVFSYLANTQEEVSEYEGFNRIVNGLSDFTKAQKSGKEDTSTFSLTGMLIDKYFMESPLWGCGNSYKGNDDAYKVNYPVSDLTTIRADATFAYYLVEFGLIGLLLYLFYYYRIIRYACLLLPPELHRISFVIFVFFLLFSMTEGGIFINSNYPYIFMYIFGVQRYYEEETAELEPCTDVNAQQ